MITHNYRDFDISDYEKCVGMQNVILGKEMMMSLYP